MLVCFFGLERDRSNRWVLQQGLGRTYEAIFPRKFGMINVSDPEDKAHPSWFHPSMDFILASFDLRSSCPAGLGPAGVWRVPAEPAGHPPIYIYI